MTKDIDLIIGKRVRMRRTILGLSQEALGDALGVTFQQIQKYERGVNRISASRLYGLAKVLAVTITFFFEDAGMDNSVSMLVAGTNLSTEDQAKIMSRETLELVRAYYKIPMKEARKSVFDLVKSLSKTQPE